MNNKSNVLLSTILCTIVLMWWFGLFNWFIGQGVLVYGPCLFITAVASIYYLISYKYPEQAWIGADNCISLGLLGTIIGLVVALPEIEDINRAAQGISLALLTTGVGLVCNIILYNHGIYLGVSEEESLK